MVVLNDSGSTQSFTLEDLGVTGRRVAYSMPGGAVATFHWRDASGGSGLAATYFDNVDLTGLSEQRIDPVVDFSWAPETYVSAEFTRPAESPMHSLGPIGFSARWEGQVLPATTETYTFHATSSDGVRLWVNGQLIIDQWLSQSATESSGLISLTAGQPATIKMEYFSSTSTGGGRVALAWSTPTLAKQIIPRERLYPPVVRYCAAAATRFRRPRSRIQRATRLGCFANRRQLHRQTRCVPSRAVFSDRQRDGGHEFHRLHCRRRDGLHLHRHCRECAGRRHQCHSADDHSPRHHALHPVATAGHWFGRNSWCRRQCRRLRRNPRARRRGFGYLGNR